MNVVLTIVLAVQMLSALGMIGLILVQHGKGADMGAAFGSGGSGSLFGASGSANFLSRTTGVLAALFFACTLLLAYFGNAQPRTGTSVLEGVGITAPAPAQAASGAAQIPGTTVPAPSSVPVPAAPAAAASGAGQIPTK
ncbi:MAG: preprotein translocase subunit SecG [Polaromonas sp. 39-63-203]|jgi:preprotein translocase subunit SecG|uniref:preprotein translocase subunit SecG n=1 Tax=Polaromonas sp. TaxID=1869339 RepID=UPI000BCEC977|nr:preprotein translocase subunit SecG [Polaromonas sp.]OYY54047.1 MAG: preprotein translocase subunit SecG [Polaromonas sp. 35-63-240]OYZ01509.1 MAG: preprotein translocase subunit SecG [Polaromonas sp. 28-63-22]OYZ85081.1 MAG: preprotein translocase subunit SecG [Polaromonas sp. 24-62-144]OZB02390.1 MAG: preprotein translocase subunit SecG [Polaromonas sp. 39-63-203]HQS30153.1 preprotein translocase subunit SecG [Polaromonas sp.]